MTAADKRPILIAGAGIAGLAGAIELARLGHAVAVFDRRTELSAAGAGIQIGPNGVKALRLLGIGAAVEKVAFRPGGLRMFDGASGVQLAALSFDERRFGAPYLTLLRSELQAALLSAAEGSPGVELSFGFDIADITIGKDGVAVTAADGRVAEGSALIGADGLWSRIRREIDAAKPVPTGYVAYRAVLARQGLPAPFDAPAVGLWLGPGAHVVHYPVSGGEMLNIVVVVEGVQRDTDWDVPGRLADLAPHLKNWPVHLQDLLKRARDWRCWTLFDMPSPARWSRDRLTLTGDAAHPVLPFLAQGAVMALEDAVALAACVGGSADDLPAAFARFGRLRVARTARLAAASRANGRTYHMAGLAARARNVALNLAPPALLLRRFDWLYGFDPAIADADGRR